MSYTVLLKKIIILGSDPTLKHVQEKAPEEDRGDATICPYFSSKIMERKPGVAGGSKWTYEATFCIAMKSGREYYSTAARHLLQLKTVVFLHWCLICTILLPVCS